MPNRYQTILDIEANTRGIEDIGRSIEDSMDTGVVERMERQVEELDGVFQTLVERQGELVTAMAKVEKGSDAYKKVKEDLDGVEQQAKATSRAIGNLNKSIGSSGGAGSGGRTWRDRAGGALRGGAATAGGVAQGAVSGSAGGFIGSIGAGFSRAAASLPFGAGAIAAGGIAAGVAGMVSAAGMARDYETYAMQTGQALPQLGNTPIATREGLAGTGLFFGKTPQQALTDAQALFAASGGTAKGSGGMAAYQTALAGQVKGVGIGQSGAFLRQFRAGGAAAGAGQLGLGQGAQALADAMRIAVMQGLKGSEVGENIGIMAGSLASIESGGGTMRSGAILGLSDMLGERGFAGQRAAKAAAGFMGAAAGMGRSGPNDALSAAMYRAAGWTPGSGAEGYAAAAFRLQNPDANLMATFLNQQMAGFSGGRLSGALQIQRLLDPLGVRVNKREALGLLQGAGGLGAKDLEGIISREGQAVYAGAERTYAQEGLGRKRAGIVGERLGIGKAQTDFVFGLEQLQIKFAAIAGTMTPVLNLLVTALNNLSAKTNTKPPELPAGAKSWSDPAAYQTPFMGQEEAMRQFGINPSKK